MRILIGNGKSSDDSYWRVDDLDSELNNTGTEIQSAADAIDVIRETDTTRLVLKTDTFPEDENTPGINIQGFICHMKRSRNAKGQVWQDVENFDLRTLKSGEYVKIELGPSRLEKIFLALARRYRDLGSIERLLNEIGVLVVDPETVMVLKGQERDTLKWLMDRDSDFWSNILDLDTTNALETTFLRAQHEKRVEALNEFDRHMDAEDWKESQWQTFFEQNEWIFGLGLSYQYLGTISTQVNLGGTDLTGRGTDVVDYLLHSSGDSRFTVLVDIKKPNTSLLNSKEYRTNIYHVSSELAGGVAQLQSYCHTWGTEGARNPLNQQIMNGAATYSPKGLLVIGNTQHLANDPAREKSFELFRRHVQNPQIITFDELFHRAEFMVSKYNHPPQIDADDDEVTMDDVPF